MDWTEFAGRYPQNGKWNLKDRIMRIRTITCHDVYNLGAGLQAYALAAYLKAEGHDVQIIDYKPDYLSRHYQLGYVPNPRFDRPLVRQAYLLAKLPGRMKALLGKRKKHFDLFRKQYLPVTVISDGRLLTENLKKAKKDGAWLHRVLRERNATLEGTWLLTVDEGNHIYYIPKEENG
jgi:hypothetical protein